MRVTARRTERDRWRTALGTGPVGSTGRGTARDTTVDGRPVKAQAIARLDEPGIPDAGGGARVREMMRP